MLGTFFIDNIQPIISILLRTNFLPFFREVDTNMTDTTNMTDIRHIRRISHFNSTLLNLRVLKYKFVIVTIVALGHILNLKKD